MSNGSENHHITGEVMLPVRVRNAQLQQFRALPVEPAYQIDKHPRPKASPADPASRTDDRRRPGFFKRSAQRVEKDPFIRRLAHLS